MEALVGKRELAYRVSGGVEVTLLWHEAEDRLTVTVVDTQAGMTFEVPAAPHNALDVFNHPFAYATEPE